MSVAALSWAIKQSIPRSSHKFVLVALANYANEQGHCYPSVEQLCQDTCQDRKTLFVALRFLRKKQFIFDTGERVGRTKQVIIYRLRMPSDNSAVSGTNSENGTVPKKAAKSSVFPSKEFRFSLKESQKRNTEPLGTVIEPSGTNGSLKKASVWELKQALEAESKIADELKNNFAFEDGFGLHWNNQIKRQDFVRCRNRIKELNRRIAQCV